MEGAQDRDDRRVNVWCWLGLERRTNLCTTVHLEDVHTLDDCGAGVVDAIEHCLARLLACDMIGQGLFGSKRATVSQDLPLIESW